MFLNKNTKPGRNDVCFCGSGKKYKHCHLKGDPAGANEIKRTPEFIEGMVRSCRLAKKTLDFIAPYVSEGTSSGRLNDLIDGYIRDHGAVPATLGYNGYPKSSCISINDVICHGIPDEQTVLKSGDIVNIDVTAILNGYFGDTCRMFTVGQCSADALQVIDVSRVALEKVLQEIKPFMRIGDIGHVIQSYAESRKCSVVREFVGHSIGRNFHEDPQIPHFGRKGTGPVIVPGMFFTIEPMINFGRRELYVEKDGWTARTADGSLSAQFEHTVMVTRDRLRPLTNEADSDPIFIH